MKTKTIVFLLALLLTVLAGCNNAPPNEDLLVLFLKKHKSHRQMKFLRCSVSIHILF